MPEKLSHDEISRRFLESGAVNFDAMGKFIAEIGPELAQSDEGLHGFIVGRYNWLACFKRWDDIQRELGGLRDIAGLTQALDITSTR